MSDVKRFACFGHPLQEMDGQFVYASDYDALAADNQRLREALEYCLDCLGSEFALPSDCIEHARAALAGSKECK